MLLAYQKPSKFFCVLTQKAKHDPVAMHYLVAHHAKEQRGDSVFLYDSIQGVQSRDIWATLLSRPELQIEAIHIRSGRINALYPAVALLNSLPEIIKHHAELEEITLLYGNRISIGPELPQHARTILPLLA